MSAENPADCDELKLAWQALDRRLERQHALELANFKRARIGDLRGALRPLAIGQWAQLIFGVLGIALFAPFWVAHRAAPLPLALGLFGHAYSIALVALAGRDLHEISQIDYSATVLSIQKRLAALRTRRIRWALFHGVANCFFWISLTLAIVHKLSGLDWSRHPRAILWLLAYGVVSLVLVSAFVFWARRPGSAQLAKRLDDSAIGRSVLRAETMLAEIAEFERS